MTKLTNNHPVHMQNSFSYDKSFRLYFRKRRAVSDIIVTLLLVSITIIGGIMAWTLVSGEGSIMEDLGSGVTEPPKTFQGGIKITAYDTRHGNDLFGITAIDNEDTNEVLCKGDHIVLKVVNNSPGFVVLNDFQINEVSHTFDSEADSLGEPDAGQFIVVDNENPTPGLLTSQINEGTTVRVIIGLNNDCDSEPIKLNRAIRVGLDASGFDLQEFIITAGSLR